MTVPSDVLAEHGLARLLRLSDRAAFAAEGVCARALTWTPCGQLSIAARDRVLFTNNGQFEFQRYLRDDAGAQNAITLPLLNEVGEFADILSFRPGGPAATWLGLSVAGAEQLYMPRPDLGDALTVHPDVIGWLRASRTGIVVLNPAKAARLLDGMTLKVGNADHARQLRLALTPPPPRIVVGEILYNIQDKVRTA